MYMEEYHSIEVLLLGGVVDTKTPWRCKRQNTVSLLTPKHNTVAKWRNDSYRKCYAQQLGEG